MDINRDPKKRRRNCIPPEEYITLAASLSIALTQGLTTAEIDNLSNFFTLLSVQVAAISSQKKFCKGGQAELIV